MKKNPATLFISILFLTVILPARSRGQVIYDMYDTLCSGDALFGYNTTGIYRDTFPTAPGDSIRVLHLQVIPRFGAPPLPRWFNTGTNDAGGTLPVGDTDLRWQVSTDQSGPYLPAIVMTPHALYSPSSWPDCAWISHSVSGAHMGVAFYFYRIGFELPCMDSCHNSFDTDSSFCLALDILVDNSVYEVFVNGAPQSASLGGFPVSFPYNYVGFSTAHMLSLNLCSGWKRGYNSLIVQVASAGPNAGFLCQASVIQSPPPPPPPVKASFEAVAAADFSVPADTGCAPHAVRFLNTSAAATGYVWDFGDGSPPSTADSPVHTYPAPGVYPVTLIATATACSTRADTIRKTIIVFPYPEVDLGPDTSVCDDTLLLQPATTYPGGAYLWSTGQTTPSITVTQTGRYWLEINYHGCADRDSTDITLTVVATDLGPDREVCAGDTVLLDATYAPGSRYLWQTGDTTAAITAATPGLYRVTVISPDGCTGSDSLVLTHYPLPAVALGRDTSVCTGTPVVLTARHEHADSLLWSDGSRGDSLETGSGGIYVVTAVNRCGRVSDTVTVEQLFCDIRVPNVFTPNGDGINDIIRILGTVSGISDVRFSIFNRWGQRVFYTQDKYRGWDGQHDGRDALPGVYAYMLEYRISGKGYFQKGNIQLLR